MFAKNVMSSQVLALRMEARATVKDAVLLLESSGLHELPVIDQEGKPVGLVSANSILHIALPGYATDDLLSLMKSGPDITSVYQNLDALLEQPLSNILDKKMNIVKLETPTSAIAAILVNLKGDSRNILVVNDSDELAGVITARDLICRRL